MGLAPLCAVSSQGQGAEVAAAPGTSEASEEPPAHAESTCLHGGRRLLKPESEEDGVGGRRGTQRPGPVALGRGAFLNFRCSVCL